MINESLSLLSESLSLISEPCSLIRESLSLISEVGERMQLNWYRALSDTRCQNKTSSTLNQSSDMSTMIAMPLTRSSRNQTQHGTPHHHPPTNTLPNHDGDGKMWGDITCMAVECETPTFTRTIAASSW